MNKLFELSSVTLGYEQDVVVKDFAWQVSRGERWLIVGANGAGKTTLIKTILGLIKPLAGKMSFFALSGEAVKAVSVGYLPQINKIDKSFPINAYDVIDSGLMNVKLAKSERQKRVAFLFDKIALGEDSSKPIGQLSGGQLQRVLLARAVASKPELLILDEPTSFLDHNYKLDFESFVAELVDDDCTIIMVTHDIVSAELKGWQTLVM